MRVGKTSNTDPAEEKAGCSCLCRRKWGAAGRCRERVCDTPHERKRCLGHGVGMRMVDFENGFNRVS